MKADPQAQQRLLDLQAIDTTVAQLAHRRRSLPELAELERLSREFAGLEDERVRAQVGVDDIDRDIARLEKDIEQVRARADKDRGRLEVGTGPARELEALQHELATLSRRQGELEDAELELMEQREQAQALLDQITQRLVGVREETDSAQVRRDEALATLDQDRAAKEAARVPLVAQLPAELVSLYEKIRQSTGGVGAAMLRGGRCEGCRLELSGSEKAKLRASESDEIVRCEECRRILVRTAESGL